jgi:hypothetical protein
MPFEKVPRPMRLWGILGLNILTAALAVASYAPKGKGPDAPPPVHYNPMVMGVTGLLALAVVVCTIVALVGRPRWRWYALGSACVFFGLRVLDQVVSMISPAPGVTLGDPMALGVAVVMIGMNLWVFLGMPADDFYESRDPRFRLPDDSALPHT